MRKKARLDRREKPQESEPCFQDGIVLSKKSGFSYWLPVHLTGIQQEINQHEELSCNRNDSFLLADFALMGPKPTMKRRASDLDGGPGGLTQN